MQQKHGCLTPLCCHAMRRTSVRPDLPRTKLSIGGARQLSWPSSKRMVSRLMVQQLPTAILNREEMGWDGVGWGGEGEGGGWGEGMGWDGMEEEGGEAM